MNARLIDREKLPLTAEGFDEELAFDEAQAQADGQIQRIATGYVLRRPGVVRHFSDCGDLHAHVFHGRNREPKGLPQ